MNLWVHSRAPGLQDVFSQSADHFEQLAQGARLPRSFIPASHKVKDFDCKDSRYRQFMNVRRAFSSGAPAGVGQRNDYSQLGRDLLAKIGVEASSGKHENVNAIWRDKATGGTIYVGNQNTAKGPADVLLAKGITHVVNCTDDLPDYCAAAGKQKYYKFNVANWQSAGASDYKDRGVEAQIAFVDKMTDWVDQVLANGGNVLVHCLAGAHRAGTTGILLLMHKEKLSREQATAAAKAARPIIDPIYDFVDLLALYEFAKAKR